MIDAALDFVMCAFLVVAGLVLAALAAFIGAALYFAASCYQSGSPDSMECFMAKGRTQQIKVDAVVK